MIYSLLNDEPAKQDLLGRDKTATTFKNYIQNCDTPFVIGIYGTWGTGKTTLMKLIREKLTQSSRNKVLTIWFDAWQYQTAQDIEITLLQKTYEVFKQHKSTSPSPKTEKVFNSALQAFKALTSTVTSATINVPGIGVEIDTKKVREVVEAIESATRDQDSEKNRQICLVRDQFEELVEKIKQDLSIDRLVFFIDDLDRCTSKNAVKIVETLKNYLNVKGCVFILGVDKKTLEQHLKKEDIAISEEYEYLDKIIQLPFYIPVIEKKRLEHFINKIFPNNFDNTYKNLLFLGLGDNPRFIKRFVNTLALGKDLISAELEPTTRERTDNIWIQKNLALILLIQYIDPNLYRIYSYNRELLKKHINIIQKGNNASEKEKEELGKISIKPKLKQVFEKFPSFDLIQKDKDYDIYFSYTDLESNKSFEESLRIHEEINSMLEQHLNWIKTNGEKGYRFELSSKDYHVQDFDFSKFKDLRGANFKRSQLLSAIFEGVDLRNFPTSNEEIETDFTEVDLAFANIRHAIFHKVSAWYSNFYNVDGEKVEFNGADLGSASFKEAKLIRADFENSKLVEAQFINADLTDANFKDADLFKADFEGAILTNAKFDNAQVCLANFNNADIAGADLSNVKTDSMTGGTIFRAKNIEQAKFHKNFWHEVVEDQRQDSQYENILNKLSQLDANLLRGEPFNLTDNDINNVKKNRE